MPQNTRNFWIELWIDGKKTKIATGPVGKDGGFNLTIKIREDGAVSENRLCIDGIVHSNGNLSAIVESPYMTGTLLTGRR